MTTLAAPWIAEAIRSGFATEEDGLVVLCPEYLETIGFAINANVLTLDFDSEADWLQDATAFTQGNELVFDIGSGLGFILPLDNDVLRKANHLVIAQQGSPVTPPARLSPFPTPFSTAATAAARFCSLLASERA